MYLKNNYPQEEFRVRQFIANFVGFRRNNSVFCKTVTHSKNTPGRGGSFYAHSAGAGLNGEVLKIF